MSVDGTLHNKCNYYVVGTTLTPISRLKGNGSYIVVLKGNGSYIVVLKGNGSYIVVIITD